MVLDKALRELNFGKDEGVVYDLLTLKQKQEIDSWSYHPEGGEGWKDLNKRIS